MRNDVHTTALASSCPPVFISNSRLTWEHAFVISSLLGLLLTVPLILFIIRSVEKDQKLDHTDPRVEPDIQPRLPLRGPIYAPIIIIAFALFTCGINMGTVEMNLVAIHQQADVAPNMIALSMGILGVMEIIGSLVFGILMDTMNKRLAMILLYGIRIFSFLILLLHTPWSPIVFAIAFGMTYLGTVPGGMLIANEFTNKKGSLVGTLLLFHQGGGILGALVGGIVYDTFQNYQFLIGIDALLCGIVVVGYFILKIRYSI